MQEFSIYKPRGENEIRLNGHVIKEVPEEIKEAVDYLTENGKKTIEARLFSDGCALRINGIMLSMSADRYADPYPRYYEAIKRFLKKELEKA